MMDRQACGGRLRDGYADCTSGRHAPAAHGTVALTMDLSTSEQKDYRKASDASRMIDAGGVEEPGFVRSCSYRECTRVRSTRDDGT